MMMLIVCDFPGAVRAVLIYISDFLKSIFEAKEHTNVFKLLKY